MADEPRIMLDGVLYSRWAIAGVGYTQDHLGHRWAEFRMAWGHVIRVSPDDYSGIAEALGLPEFPDPLPSGSGVYPPPAEVVTKPVRARTKGGKYAAETDDE